MLIFFMYLSIPEITLQIYVRYQNFVPIQELDWSVDILYLPDFHAWTVPTSYVCLVNPDLDKVYYELIYVLVSKTFVKLFKINFLFGDNI